MCEALPPTLHSKQLMCGKRYGQHEPVSIAVEQAQMYRYARNAIGMTATLCVSCGLRLINYERQAHCCRHCRDSHGHGKRCQVWSWNRVISRVCVLDARKGTSTSAVMQATRGREAGRLEQTCRNVRSRSRNRTILRRVAGSNEEVQVDSAAGAAATGQPACLTCLKAVECCFVPCGHACFCMACAGKLFARPCPVCRGTVDYVHRIYLP